MRPNKLEKTSLDGTNINLDALYQIAPSCFTEVEDKSTGEMKRVVNFDMLKEFLGDNSVEEKEEMYQFTWAGKQGARRESAKPISDTLRPVMEDSVDWDTTQNLYIEGDNLSVLKLLQKGYMGKVKMIYIDPPYNTGNDFVYNDDFSRSQSEEELEAGNIDEFGNRYRKNLDSNGRFHSDWCSMIYSRLLVARSLLTEDGIIFISIDDNEVHNLRKICDEVFGASNFVADIIWERAYAPINLKKHFSPSHDFILCYSKNVDLSICNGISRSDEADGRYSNPDNDPRGVWQSDNLSVGPAIESNIYPITTPSGRVVEPPAGRSWSLSEKAFSERLRQNRIWFGSDGNGVPRMKRFLSELRKSGITPMTIWKYSEVGHSQDATQRLADIFDGNKFFDYPKPIELIKRCISLYSDNDSLILDFFSGSGTTAHAVMQLNAEDGGKRRYICVQLPEATPDDSEARKEGYNTIPDIAKERIRRAGKKIKETEGEKANDLDTGFRVLRLDSTNFNEIQKSPSEYDQTSLDDLIDNVKEDRNDMDLLFGAILSWGLQLSLPMKKEKVADCAIYTVNEGELVACFDKEVTEEVVRAIADKKPQQILFRDTCFAEDKMKINIFEIFKQQLEWSEETALRNIRVI